MHLALVLLTWLGILNSGLSARILAVIPFPGPSHYIFMATILRTLTQQGHHVVEYSPFPLSKPSPNHTHFEVHTGIEKHKKKWTYADFVRMSNSDKHVGGFEFRAVWNKTYSVCEDVLQHEHIQRLLNSEQKFDLVIIESTFGQESMAIFGHKFKAPVVSLQAFPTWSGLNRNTGNSLSIASVPDLASFLVATDHMSYMERFWNLVYIVLTQVNYYYYHIPKHEEIIKNNYKNEFPPLIDMIRNISMYFVNSHPAIEYIRPYTPNIVPIGGITISPDRVSLPQDIQKFMDDSKEGVIYFSFGTVVPAHILPNKTLKIFVNVFKKLTVDVIWKIDLESIPGLSNNVMITKWVPQPGILAHPKCLLFITHGGLFSLQDAIFAGVPTLGISFFGDQHANIRFSEHRRFGVKVELNNLSEKTLHSALNKVLMNPEYKENAKHLSQIYRDRPMSPADSVVFWVEYVIKHRGAHHLKPAATNLSWYQLGLLDILAAMLATVILTPLAIYLITCKILSLFVCTKKYQDTYYDNSFRKKNKRD